MQSDYIPYNPSISLVNNFVETKTIIEKGEK